VAAADAEGAQVSQILGWLVRLRRIGDCARAAEDGDKGHTDEKKALHGFPRFSNGDSQ
jgi:hypothetical protein